MIPAPTVEALSGYPDGDRWELRSHLELPAVTSAVPRARHHARRVLADWHLDDRADVTELIVTELVTNAVRAYPGGIRGVPCVRLRLCADLRARVLVQVYDASDTMPELHEPGLDAVGGRGLVLVDALSDRWGSYRTAALPGKCVWAQIGPADLPAGEPG